VTPRRFRIIATLNTVDRQFVNSLSQALRRRFTFITVDIPSKKPDTEAWGHAEATSLASREFTLVAQKAIERVARRVAEEDEINEKKQELEGVLYGDGLASLTGLFDLVARMRYAQTTDQVPYIPIGTAQMIDTVELFLMRVVIENTIVAELSQVMDWAASVKIAPLLDSDTINNEDLERLAASLATPFNRRFRSEIMQIASAGMYYVGS
jgi:MoxR-like ATPase